MNIFFVGWTFSIIVLICGYLVILVDFLLHCREWECCFILVLTLACYDSCVVVTVITLCYVFDQYPCKNGVVL
jgi:hypothetical protein